MARRPLSQRSDQDPQTPGDSSRNPVEPRQSRDVEIVSLDNGDEALDKLFSRRNSYQAEIRDHNDGGADVRLDREEDEYPKRFRLAAIVVALVLSIFMMALDLVSFRTVKSKSEVWHCILD